MSKSGEWQKEARISNNLLYSVEYHHFMIRDHWLLFDVNALTVIDSCTIDGRILDLAACGASAESMIKKLIIDGEDAALVRERLDVLFSNRFLLLAGDKPDLARLPVKSGYATFMVNVSQKCNLTCSYCYVNKGSFDYDKEPHALMPSAISDELVEKIFEKFPDFDTYAFHFYGGEPLINFDAIKKIVLSAEAKAKTTETTVEFHITTNGTLLDRKVADFMDRYRFTVYLSVDGDEKIHDEVRTYIDGRGSYRDIEENLKYVRTKPNIFLIGSSVVRKGFSLKDAVRYLDNMGAQQYKAERVRLSDGDVIGVEGKEYDSYLNDLKDLADHYIDSLSMAQRPKDYRLSARIMQLLTKTKRNSFCPAGERMFGISGNGEIYPCALHVGRSGSILGNLLEGVMNEAQNNFFQKFGLENQKECGTCWTRYLCGGGCSAMVDRFNKDDCAALRVESEAAIGVYSHFKGDDAYRLYALVSPSIVEWIENGDQAEGATES